MSNCKWSHVHLTGVQAASGNGRSAQVDQLRTRNCHRFSTVKVHELRGVYATMIGMPATPPRTTCHAGDVSRRRFNCLTAHVLRPRWNSDRSQSCRRWLLCCVVFRRARSTVSAVSCDVSARWRTPSTPRWKTVPFRFTAHEWTRSPYMEDLLPARSGRRRMCITPTAHSGRTSAWLSFFGVSPVWGSYRRGSVSFRTVVRPLEWFRDDGNRQQRQVSTPAVKPFLRCSVVWTVGSSGRCGWLSTRRSTKIHEHSSVTSTVSQRSVVCTFALYEPVRFTHWVFMTIHIGLYYNRCGTVSVIYRISKREKTSRMEIEQTCYGLTEPGYITKNPALE